MIAHLVHSTRQSVRRICEVLELPRSSYYHAALPTATQRSDEELGPLIEAIFTRHCGRYGHRRIWEELRDQGTVCALVRVARLMRERGLRAIQPKNYIPRTSDGRADKPSANLLQGQPLPDRPDRVWAGDLTFIRTERGWLYLAVIIDLCTRRIVGWSLAAHMRAELVTHALEQALASRRPKPGLIFHSDRGSQYGSKVHRRILASAGMSQSMSARANPYHNAWTESFMGTFKREILPAGKFQDEAHARREIFAYIEGYYHNHRKHSSLGYLTPTQFEAQILSLN